MTDTDSTPATIEPTARTPEGEAWPNTVRDRAGLDAALEAGLASGISPHSIEEIAERALGRLRDG